MAYQGNLAYDYESRLSSSAAAADPRQSSHVLRQSRPRFGVIEGRGLDAKVRAGVGLGFLRQVKLVVALVALCAAIGFVRVGLLSAQVVTLQQNARLSARIDQAELHNSELKVERSILSNSTRIGRIATQTYGMVLPEQVDTITLGSSESVEEE